MNAKGGVGSRGMAVGIIVCAVYLLILAGCNSLHRDGCLCGCCGQAALCRVVTVYDGKTFTAELHKEHPRMGKRLHVKIAGIDCPKEGGRRFFCSEGCDPDRPGRAKAFTESKLRAARVIRLENVRRQENVRLFPFDPTVCVIADVDVDGRDLASILLQERHADPEQ